MTSNDTDGDEAHGKPPERPTAADGDVAALEASLADRGESYARVTVVRREPPVSANVGDRAVVTADGELHGWIGGVACAQQTAISEATAALESGEPQLVGIAIDPETVDRPGLEAFPMRCHSEGVLELFIEPVNPTPTLLIVGNSPVARSLARLAGELAVDVTLVDPDADPDDAHDVVTATDPDALVDAAGPAPLVVVASMGQYDARGVAAGIRADAPYIGLVASDARGTEVTDRAAELLGVDPDTVAAAVTTPAGVDIAAHSPAEIAISILAEVVDARSTAGVDGSRTGTDTAEAEASGTEAADEAANADAEPPTDDGDDPATDPVCGMAVEPGDAPTVEHAGTTYHFCCAGCADSFRNDPDSYLPGEPASP
jgi:xanthine dehydrogenase accessory factor